MKKALSLLSLAALTIVLLGSCNKEQVQSRPDSLRAIPEGALPGEFSVSSTKKVHFSRGNLVATIDASGTPTAWKFATNQYDCLAEGGANKTIGTAAGDVDLFGWSTAISNYGIKTSKDSKDYAGDFVDWGKNIDNKGTWRTLSYEEWKYLSGTSEERNEKYRCNVTICGKTKCTVFAPDNFTGEIQKSYDAAAWANAEAAGLVCLPAAGFRYISEVDHVGDLGLSWSSSAIENDGTNSYDVSFGKYFEISGEGRAFGNSVRLVTDSK